MALEPVVDIEALCAEFEGESRVGEFLAANSREDPVGQLEFGIYRRLKGWEDSRVQGLWGRERIPEPLEETWQDLAEKCYPILTERSKDLRAFAMMSVAISFQHGLVGVRDALALLNRVIDVYGNDLHPQPADEAFKALPSVPELIASAVRVAPFGEDGQWLCTLRKEISEYVAGASLSDEQKKHFSANSITKAEFNSALHELSLEHLTDLCEAATEAKDICQQVSTSIKKLRSDNIGELRAGREFGGFRSLQKSIEDVLATLEPIRKAKQKKASVAGTETDTGVLGGDSAIKVTRTRVSGPVGSRAQAIDSLRQVRDYFLRAEPHSPLPFILERAINWSEKSLQEILSELLAGHAGAANALAERANIPIGDASRKEMSPTVISPNFTDEVVVDDQSVSANGEEKDPFG